jgi:hypothetical protein
VGRRSDRRETSEISTAARKLALTGKRVSSRTPTMIDWHVSTTNPTAAHRPAGVLIAEALLDGAVAGDEHGDTDKHPQSQLPLKRGPSARPVGTPLPSSTERRDLTTGSPSDAAAHIGT